MQKKSLGRGLEDITDIFISQKKKSIPVNDSISKDSIKVIDGSDPNYLNRELKASITATEDSEISANGKRHSVNDNNSNTEPSYQYDYPGKDGGPTNGKLENAATDCSTACEITEHVTINKNMEYLNTPDVQKSVVNSLFKYLRQNYKIKKLELAKVNKVSKPGMTNIIEENILIYIK